MCGIASKLLAGSIMLGIALADKAQVEKEFERERSKKHKKVGSAYGVAGGASLAVWRRSMTHRSGVARAAPLRRAAASCRAVSLTRWR